MQDIWQWVIDAARLAQENQDQPRMDLYLLFSEAMDLIETNPDRSLQLMRAGQALARNLNERWWLQLFVHWELQVQMFFRCDYHGVIERSVEAVLEVLSRPEYTRFPQRVCLHEDLIVAYKERDPHGYRQEIEQAIEYMEANAHPDWDCSFCLNSKRVEAAIDAKEFGRARTLGLAYAERSRDRLHYLSDAHQMLCEVAFHDKDWERLLEWSLRVEQVAREDAKDGQPDRRGLMVGLAWQAVAQRQLGNESLARSLYTGAAQLYANYRAEPVHTYFDAMAGFHDVRDEHKASLNIRQHQLKRLEGQARYFKECECRLEVLRLKKALDMPLAEDVAALRQMTTQYLKAPDFILNQLAPYEA